MMSKSDEKGTTNIQRYKVTIAYDGSLYVGFQHQINGQSIQEVFEKALHKLSKGQHIKIVASGRTDSGVHAFGQVVHFDYFGRMTCDSMKKALNSVLPESIRVEDVECVSQLFHARYHTSGKRYEYYVDCSKVQSPFTRLYQLHHPFCPSIEKMNDALISILGTHDFSSFCSTKTDKENKVRTVTLAKVEWIDESRTKMRFTFEGDGFLYNMIRILVGTTLQIGDGLKPVDELKRVLALKDRNQAGPTAKAHGLYLAKVFYKDESEWFQTYEENKAAPLS